MIMPKIYCTTGYAGAGKDTFCELFGEELKKDGKTVKKFAFADKLKEEMRPILLEKYKIDILNCSRAEKEILRPDIVEYAVKKRRENPDHWVNLVKEDILRTKTDCILISDGRYRNEADFVHSLGGWIINIDAFFVINGKEELVGPANDEERKNGREIIEVADFYIKWRKKTNLMPGELSDWCNKYIKDFIKVCKENGHYP